jgi:hypothetical protein
LGASILVTALCRKRLTSQVSEPRLDLLALEPRMVEVKGEQGYAGAFGAMDNARGQPIILPAGGMFLRDRAAIAQALLEHRIPSIAAFRENMEAGALISYGFDLMGLFYDIASYEMG